MFRCTVCSAFMRGSSASPFGGVSRIIHRICTRFGCSMWSKKFRVNSVLQEVALHVHVYVRGSLYRKQTPLSFFARSSRYRAWYDTWCVRSRRKF